MYTVAVIKSQPYKMKPPAAAELRGIRKIAVASLRTEVAAETATRIRQIRLRSKLRGIYILRRIKKGNRHQGFELVFPKIGG